MGRTQAADAPTADQVRRGNALRARIAASPVLPFTAQTIAARPPYAGWTVGTVSWLALGHDGSVYELQRGADVDPVVVMDTAGRVLRSWGKGAFTIPHSIRLDAQGNVWTVDAGSSMVIEWSAVGTRLLTIEVGEQPAGGGFTGATDIGFAPDGHLYIADGYGNARLLVYDRAGHRLRVFGGRGAGRGEFHLPHALQVEPGGAVDVADRENGRIVRMDPRHENDAAYREIDGLGRVLAIKRVGGVIWATVQAPDRPVTAGGWIVKIDGWTGKLEGHLDLPPLAGHALEVTAAGEPMVTIGQQVLWFRGRTA